MKIDNEFDFFQVVYLKTDKDQCPRMVTNMCVKPGPVVTYELSCGSTTSWHYAEEISIERNILITTDS